MYYEINTLSSGKYYAETISSLNSELIELDWEDIMVTHVCTVAQLALCEGRHQIDQAKDGAIFPQEIADPMNFGALYEIARDVLTPLVVKNKIDQIDLYVTGLTPALLETLNVCRKMGIKVVTYNYDRNTGNYLPLPIE